MRPALLKKVSHLRYVSPSSPGPALAETTIRALPLLEGAKQSQTAMVEKGKILSPNDFHQQGQGPNDSHQRSHQQSQGPDERHLRGRRRCHIRYPSRVTSITLLTLLNHTSGRCLCWNGPNSHRPT